MGGLVLFAHGTAILRVKWDREQSAVHPVRERTWTRGEQAEARVTSAVMKRKNQITD